MTWCYELCGLAVESDIELPELCPRENCLSFEIEIRLGEVPQAIENGDVIGPLFQSKGSHLYLLNIPDVARYLLKSGRHIIVEAYPGSSEIDIRVFLLGTVQGALWLQRGLLPLHASAVRINKRAVLFTGASTAGKSTTAAFLARRGHALLADDISVIDARSASIIPSFPRLKLWRDALEALSIDAAQLPRAVAGLEKYALIRHTGFPKESHAISAIVGLDRSKLYSAPEIKRLRGMEALTLLSANIYRRRVARAFGLFDRVFSDCGQLLAKAPMFTLSYGSDLSRIDEALDLVERTVPVEGD